MTNVLCVPAEAISEVFNSSFSIEQKIDFKTSIYDGLKNGCYMQWGF